MTHRKIQRFLLVALLALTALSTSCAYYNTFYVARKYYFRATQGEPYRYDTSESPDISNLNKSIDYSKKLLATYPKSKWVDDAYLLWARAYLAKNDPLQTISMLQDFSARYPNSPIAGEANFYSAVALRQARRYGEALTGLEDFVKRNPKSKLVPYASLEAARTLMSLGRPADAARAAGVVVERWPSSPLATTARIARAEALFTQGDFDKAREDYRFLDQHSRDDDERLGYLLRESECLEGAQHYEEALSLLKGALFHEQPPVLPDTTGGRALVVQQTPGYDRYGRLLTRIGTVELMSGRVREALDSYQRVVDAYPKSPVAAEAQYRIGYAYEVGADDFDKARAAYGKVRDQSPGSPFATQAQQRQNTLDQLARFRTAGTDSVDRKAEASFLLAEQYLFQLDKPDRALDVYQTAEQQNLGNPWGGKAINAQAWVLARKFNRPSEAESLYWKVVHDYPATEAQLAARDYLEAMGQVVPADLIHYPEPHFSHADSVRADSLVRVDSLQAAMTKPLTPPPATVPPIGPHPPVSNPDSLGGLGRSASGIPMSAPGAGAAVGAGAVGLAAGGANAAGGVAGAAGAAGSAQAVTPQPSYGHLPPNAATSGTAPLTTVPGVGTAAGAAVTGAAGGAAALGAPPDSAAAKMTSTARPDTLRLRPDNGFRPRGFKIQ
jgi:tetratricopeptide (TPR) repeat protein